MGNEGASRMKRRGPRSLRSKQTLILLTASAAALLIACAGFMAYDLLTFRRSMTLRLGTLAEVLGRQAAVAMDFGDVRHAEEVLGSLNGLPEITGAWLYTPDGRAFAQHPGMVGIPGPAGVLPGSGHRFEGERLIVFRRMEREGEVLGAIGIESNLEALNARLRVYGWTVAGLLVLALGAGHLVSRRLQRVIVTPLLELAEATRAVVRDGDYSVRVHRRADDELGQLIDGFNGMLERIQDRDIALERARAELEARVEERTGALSQEIAERRRAEEDLERARNAAEAASRAKSEFLAVMSHEIRTPMNAVIGMTGLLIETNLQPRQREYVDAVRLSGEALLEIINSILDFSKIEAGPLVLECAAFDPRNMADGLVEMLSSRAQDKGLEIVAIVDPGVPSGLKGDEGRIRQVLVNLLGNAIKFTERGEVTLRLGSRAGTGERVRLRFEVTDTGIGIASELLPDLFTPFVQADTSASRRFGGTGLGLAVCRRLVDCMGGRIGVESEPGVGSSFWVELELEAVSGGVGVPVEVPGELGGVRVLVVDRHAATREAVAGYLRAWGMPVDEAASGEAALARLVGEGAAGRSFGVVIAERHLPDLSGPMLAARCQDLVPPPRLILTAPVSDCLVPCLAPGVLAQLPKPVRASTLLETLSRGGEVSAAQAAAGGGPVAVAAVDSVSLGGVPGSGLRILVVEDHELNRRMAMLMLQKLGYRPQFVENGREALDALERGTFDLVLMDCQMPVMDGYAATRHIRDREARGSAAGRRRVAIVALTANAMRGDVEKCLEAGMDGYLSKPVRLEDLRAAIARFTGLAAPGSASVSGAGVGVAVGEG